jgi:putative heme-binding domain-containing protein
MIGKKASRENLFESILYPDKAIADQFVQYTVLDQNGVTLTGLLIEDTPEHLLLRDANGKDTKIQAKDIDQKAKSPKSIMPSDLLAYISDQDLVDIVAYLETLKTPALAIGRWYILGPFDNGAGDAGLDKQFISEGGTEKLHPLLSSMSFPGKHGEIRWRTISPNAMGYVDLAAHFAPNNQQIVSYLHCNIDSPVEQAATILLGTDDGCKLFVNGKEVLSHRRHEAATPERDTVPVQLNKGSNSILLKINNGDGPHGFYFSMVSDQELKRADPR